MMWGNNWGWWFAGTMMMLLFWGGIAALVVYGIRSWNRPREEAPRSGPSAAMGILEERFARGEISKEEFEERRRVLAEHAA